MTKPARGAHSPLEWPAAIAGTLLIVGVIGFLLWDGLAERGRGSVPRITVRADSAIAYGSGGQYILPIEVTNSGGVAAASVIVEGTLADAAGSDVARSEITIALLPASSSRSAGLVFDRDPRQYTLSLRPLGFERP